MPFGIGLPDIIEDPLNRVPGVGRLIETDEEKRRKRKRKRRPPPPPGSWRKRKDKEKDEDRRDGFRPPTTRIARGVAGPVAEFATGIIPALGVIGRAAAHDVRHPDMPSRNDFRDYWRLAKWTVADEKGDKRKRPKTDSEVLGLAADIIRGMGRGFEQAVPTPWDRKDVEEAREKWRDNWLFAAMDVVPVASLMTRPLSIARHTRNIERANSELSATRAAMAGVKESYRPGAARRAGLEGGIERRVHRAKVGDEVVEVPARPWSRNPLMREAQRGYDEVFKRSPISQRKRVARHEERLGREARREKNLEVQELSLPIARVIYSRAGRLAGAFGVRTAMTAAERARARALVAAFQMPRHLSPEEALAAWQIDKQQILQSGKIEVVSDSGRLKQMPLRQSDREALTHEITDIQRAREELGRGDIDSEEFTAALESMQQVTAKVEEMGGTIMRDFHKLDEDEMAELLASWSNRASMIPRRLEARGILGHSLEESLERTEWIERWRQQLGDEKAMVLTGATDRLARKMYPHDPAGFYADKIGRPGLETPEELAARTSDVRYQDFPEYGTTRLIEGDVAAPPATTAFYSQLQQFIADEWPVPGKPVPWKQLRGSIQNNVSPEEWKNSNLEEFFNKHVNENGDAPVYQADIQEHLAQPLNAYNLKEHHFVNTDEARDAGFDPEYDDRQLLSRDPADGEYHELVYEVANPRQRYMGTGADHWKELPNITFHMRLQDFTEHSTRKVVKEELQSDHASDIRKGVTEEARREWEAAMAAREEALRNLSPEQRDRLADMEMEDDSLRDELIDLAEPLDEWERANPNALMDEMPDDIRQMVLRYDDIEERLRQLDDDMHALAPRDAVYTAPVPPNPFGQNRYIRTAARRLMRYARDNGVDEVIISDPTVQFLRNGPYRPELTMDMLGKSTNAEVRAILDEIVTPSWVRLYGEKYRQIFDEEFGVAGVVKDDAYIGRYAGQMYGMSESIPGPMRGIVYKVTDEVRERASRPQALYQRQPDFKGLPKGATEYLEGGRTRIHLFERGDVSTWIHELGHVAMHDLPDADQQILHAYYAGGRGFDDWKVDEHENYARDLEEFVRRGRAPTRDLQAVFQKLANWIKEIWEIEKRSNRDLDPEVEEVFERMFGQTADDLRNETWGYFPHRDIDEIASQEYRGGVRPPAAGQTLGVPRMTGQTLQRKGNELIRYQTGRLSPDPIHLMDVFLRRTRFLETLQARHELWAMGRPLSEQPPPGAWFIRNPDAAPERIQPRAQAAVRGQRTTQDLAKLEGRLSGDAEEIRRTMLAKPDEHPAWMDDTEDVRWVPGEYVETRFGEVFEQRPRGSMWSALGMLNSLQRMTGIYGRPAAYILGNIPFNTMALMASMPVSTLRNAGAMARIGFRDPKLYRAIASQTGETRASGGLPDFYVAAQNRLQRAEQRTTQFQRASADVLSKAADTPFRVTAFLNNARKRGFNTDAKLRELIENEDFASELSDIRQLTREQLLDFDALNPTQRRMASQFLFLWPFIYASVKWPAMFAREYPLRAGAIAEASEQTGTTGPQAIANLWAEHGVDLSTLNPAGPLGEIAEQAQLFAQDPSKMDLTVLQERVSPTISFLAESMTGGHKNALQNFLRQTVPGAAELFSADPQFRGGKQYKDQSRAAYLAQRYSRFYPRGVNPEVIKERVEQFHKDRVTTDTRELEREKDWEKLRTYYEQVGGDVEEIRRSYIAWHNYQEAVDEKKETTGQRKLTPFQTIEILHEIVEEEYPELASELWSLEGMDQDYQRKYETELGEYAETLKKHINAGRTQLFNDYRSYASP